MNAIYELLDQMRSQEKMVQLENGEKEKVKINWKDDKMYADKMFYVII